MFAIDVTFITFCTSYILLSCFIFFFFKQKTAYEMRISDWSSDVCSSDLLRSETMGGPPLNSLILKPYFVGGTPLLALPRGRAHPDGRHDQRSEERRVGKECVSTCRSRWSPYH